MCVDFWRLNILLNVEANMLPKCVLAVWHWLMGIFYWDYVPVTLSTEQMLEFLTENYGNTPETIASGRLAQCSDTMYWRRHDWGVAGTAGYQASDSVLNCSHTAVIQTLDFGYTPEGWDRFDLASGDGGQVIKIVDNCASIVMTQDGGDGIQWFIGAVDSELGWLLFRNTVTDHWQEETAWLNKGTSADSRPWLYNPAFTRYKRISLSMPWMIQGVAAASTTLDVIVCQHYNGTSIANADTAECFYFAKGYGWIRWESWQNSAKITVNQEQAAEFAASGRMPVVNDASLDQPAGWVMIDGRNWTNWVSYPTGYSVDTYHWQAGNDVS